MKLILEIFILFTLIGVAMATEEPKYTIVSKNEVYEVRKYDSVIVAETSVDENFEDAGSTAFKILAGYIFGGNKSQTKIAMTAPVAQIKGESGFFVQFTMPKGPSLNTLPSPNDARVKLIEIPSRKVAAYTYSGTWSESRFKEKLSEFQDALKRNGESTYGGPIFARYNSPFQIWFLRRNEIWINLSE